ncbi:hypothetical protein F5B22DRAFT_595657 [Xylaria bambusicola]|uniref:uncharacterized protein n=1 Tax=Xylaria bambusicola TaxID=326684 RepID=UPI0020087CC7|nr:uncharacterized protein F5B22DRAFT_595657 [Xylaria bambusicola]KAI0521608.1 hypothetical protein F5B22DRAFT_595657 [Xylaria bambusicola]
MTMQHRILLRRLFLLPALKPKNPTPTRLLIRQSQLNSRSRPQLPFLSTPLAKNHQFRYLTTERKRWLVYEVYLAFKYTVYFWAIVGFSVIAYWSVQQEWLERKYPTPHEWGFLTRLRFRVAKWGPDRTDWVGVETDWVVIGEYAKNVIERLEDRKIEGAGVEDLMEGGIWIDGIGNSGYDITAKSEPWQRGYYEALMLAAKAAEQLDDHVLDTTRRIVFPASTVIGPSNPNPKPIPAGAETAPREENCERAFEEPEMFYMRILTTRGFSSKQKMDAALAYASWLDFKEVPEAAIRMYDWALSLASENTPPTEMPYDKGSYVLRDNAPTPSKNILDALTALATHKARNGDISSALPILLSILRARRSLPETQPKFSSTSYTQPEPPSNSPWTASNILSTIKRLVAPPAYPPPPPSGDSPPIRDAQERCEEAGLNLYIGEIIYASRAREDGVAWTREAVDLAEEQLHKLGPSPHSSGAKKTCRECLSSGLENWAKMAARLAREEREKEAAPSASSGSTWFGLWGDSKQKREEETIGRWAAEENVVKERTRRAQDVLDELEAPSTPFSSIFSV